MTRNRIMMVLVALLAPLVSNLRAAETSNAVQPGELVCDPGSFTCLSFRWFVKGDANYNATLTATFREAGQDTWEDAFPFMRVKYSEIAKGDKKIRNWRKGMQNPNLLAGSIFHLQPGREYEVRLKLGDPDGGAAEKTVNVRTRALPAMPSEMKVIEATPADAVAKLKELKAGDRLVLAPGTYPKLAFKAQGREGLPVIVEGADRDRVIVDGGVAFSGPHIWVSKLTVRNAEIGIHAEDAPWAVVSHCHATVKQYGVFAEDSDGTVVTDNTVRGPCTWPRSKGIESPHGIETRGAHVIVTHNRVSGFADGISNNNYYECVNWEVSFNEVSECTDDGIEVDFCAQNARIFNNRFTNTYQAVSVAPTLGGPIYILRNEIFNTFTAYKMQRTPTGLVVFNNSSFSWRHAMYCPSAERWHRVTFKNNLFAGAGFKAMEVTPGTDAVDFDYIGWGPHDPKAPFAKWNQVNFESLAAMQKAGQQPHSIAFEPSIWAKVPVLSVVTDERKAQHFEPSAYDYALNDGAAAIDKGLKVPNLLGPYSGEAPDLGAREHGAPAPHFGPRP
ncbi:MAG: hypothetical protein AMXMBFR7_02600 [Planctomycetota bacterium]